MSKIKVKQIISSIVITVVMLISTSTVGFAETRPNLNNNEDVKYWAEHFDNFNDQLNDGSLKELVGTSSVYIKYTQDESDTKENLKTEVLTEKEYNQELMSKKRVRRSIGQFEKDGGKDPSWLKLDLQVFETAPGKYSACSFWEWKTKPACSFTDLNGIYVSSEMLIGAGTTNTQYITIDSYGNRDFNTPSIASSQFGNGVASKINLRGSSEIIQYKNHMGMMQTPVEFANTGSTSGRIYTNYVHKQVAVGGVSFNTLGKASFGLTISTDEHAGSVHIQR